MKYIILFILIIGCGTNSNMDSTTQFPIDLGEGCLQIADNELGTVVVCDIVEIRGLTEEEQQIFDDLASCLDEQWGLTTCNPPEPIVYVANYIECGTSTSKSACTAQFGESIAIRPHSSISDITHELVHVHQWNCGDGISLHHCEDYWNNFCGEHFLNPGSPRICN